jgi:hypothetical protein
MFPTELHNNYGCTEITDILFFQPSVILITLQLNIVSIPEKQDKEKPENVKQLL